MQGESEDELAVAWRRIVSEWEATHAGWLLHRDKLELAFEFLVQCKRRFGVGYDEINRRAGL